LKGGIVVRWGLLSKVVVVYCWGLLPWAMVVSVQPVVVVVELELVVTNELVAEE
jgi:hypothetical protein